MASKITTHQITLERGVHRIEKPSERVVYVASANINGRRRQFEFDDPEVANTFKRNNRARKGRRVPELTKEEYFAERAAAASLNRGDQWTTVQILERHAELFPESSTNVNILKRFLREKDMAGTAAQLTREVTETAPQWIQAEGYTSAVASRILQTADRAWDIAIGSDRATVNRWKGLKAKSTESETDRRGRKRPRVKAGAFDAATAAAVARLLRAAYLLAFWIVVILGVRRSELMGFRIIDWHSEQQCLVVAKQRRGSSLAGLSRTKTLSSVRKLYAPPSLADAIDRYILTTHGPAPDDPTERDAWAQQYLLVGVQGGPMDSASFMKALNVAYAELGMTRDELGRFSPIHHWRSSLGALLQRPEARLSGAAIANLMGHKHPERMDADVPDVTATHYNPLIHGEMERLFGYISTWVRTELLPALGTDDLLDLGTLADPMPMAAASALFHSNIATADEAALAALITNGDVAAVKINHGNDKQMLLVERSHVEIVIAAHIRSSSTTYSATEVCELLACDRDIVYRLADTELITEETVDPAVRTRSTRGRGGLPGGGRRYSRQSVDLLVDTYGEEIERRRTWLTVGQTAALLEVSQDTVRRMADRNHRHRLNCWRDPWTTHERRLIDPGSVKAMKVELAEMTLAEAATMLDRSVNWVRAQIKLGVIRRGIDKTKVLAIDVRRLHSEEGAA